MNNVIAPTYSKCFNMFCMSWKCQPEKADSLIIIKEPFCCLSSVFPCLFYPFSIICLILPITLSYPPFYPLFFCPVRPILFLSALFPPLFHRAFFSFLFLHLPLHLPFLAPSLLIYPRHNIASSLQSLPSHLPDCPLSHTPLCDFLSRPALLISVRLVQPGRSLWFLGSSCLCLGLFSPYSLNLQCLSEFTFLT